jgi:aromatic ring-opening dioxygenase catalytic subunit (LigB family)
MIRFKRLISIIAASLTLTLSSCAPNSGFTLIFSTEEETSTIEINKDVCEIKIKTPIYITTHYCLKVEDHGTNSTIQEWYGFTEGPLFIYYFFYEPYFNGTQYLQIFYLPENKEPFQDSRLKTTNWFMMPSYFSIN